MATRTVAIAPIRLARQTGRLLATPLLASLAALLALATAWLIADRAPALAVALVAAGGIGLLAALAMAALLLSVRLEVEVASLRLRWLGGSRRYRLVRGAVTRVALRGAGAVKLYPRFGALGWAFGKAILRDEPVEVVRLAAASSLVLIPTDQGRLAVAPANERELIEALTAAARVQHRLEQAAAQARPVGVAVSAPGPALAAASLQPPATGVILTGIERARLDAQLAAQRSAALAAAEADRRAALEAARASAVAAIDQRQRQLPIEDVVAAPRAVRPRERARWARPAWANRPRVTLPAVRLPTERLARLNLPAVTLPRVPLPHIPLPALPWPDHLSTRARLLLFATPTLVAGLSWLLADALRLLPETAEGVRLVTLALVLGGPIALAGALFAWRRFPRLAGLVAVTGLLSLALVGRSLVV